MLIKSQEEVEITLRKDLKASKAAKLQLKKELDLTKMSSKKIKSSKSELSKKNKEIKGLKTQCKELEKMIKKIEQRYDKDKIKWSQEKSCFQDRLDHLLTQPIITEESDKFKDEKSSYIKQLERQVNVFQEFRSDNEKMVKHITILEKDIEITKRKKEMLSLENNSLRNKLEISNAENHETSVGGRSRRSTIDNRYQNSREFTTCTLEDYKCSTTLNPRSYLGRSRDIETVDSGLAAQSHFQNSMSSINPQYLTFQENSIPNYERGSYRSKTDIKLVEGQQNNETSRQDSDFSLYVNCSL